MTEAFWLYCAKQGVPTDQIQNSHKRAWHALSELERVEYEQELQRVIGAHISETIGKYARPYTGPRRDS